MVGITASGVGSGLDVNAIISQLMAYEKQPLQKLQQQQSQVQAQISSYGSIKSALDTFQTAMQDLSSIAKFQTNAASSSNETVFTATADETASVGTSNIDVTRLAQRHKMASAEYLNTTTFGGSSATDSLDITVGTSTMSVDLYNGGAGRTLEQIRDAINSDSTNPGITATVINGNNSMQKLVLTSNDSGYDQRIQLAYGGNITSADLNLATINQNAAGTGTIASLTDLDAALTVDGYSVTRASNTITDLIQGVTLNLAGTGTSTLDITRDNGAVSDSVQSFVDAYNALRDVIDKQRSGNLSGDTTLLTIDSQLRSVLDTKASGLTYGYLSEIGVTTLNTDKLSLDSTALTNALNSDFSSVAQLFANDPQGVAYRLQTAANNLLATGGLIQTRTDGLTSRIDTLQASQDSMQRRLDMIQARYQKQFTALDSLVAQMNSTSNYLTQQLANLPG